MTGTAMTEASEFAEIYGLEVIEVPPNVPVLRDDEDDQVYRTAKEKYQAIVEAIKDGQERGQPILVGTASIEKSELISGILKQEKIEHQVLNARYHEQEAYIIAQAGRPGAVTIATNMAGRGTDIQLGGNVDMAVAEKVGEETDPAKVETIRATVTEEVAELKRQALEAGGLWVLATERHESRRIDNQLRGRSGRQGDPGRSTFYLSLEDDLMRIFGSEKMDGMLRRLGLEDGEAIVHRWVNKAIERAQGKVEARNFEIRKNVLKYDDVMNDQRKAIFEQRRDIMESDDISDDIRDYRHTVVEELVATHIPEKAYAEQWETEKLEAEVGRIFGAPLPIKEWADQEGVDDEAVRERLIAETDKLAAKKTVDLGGELMRRIEKDVVLQMIDHRWREHLSTLDHLRSVIGFRGYAQRDPLNEYKTEAFGLFESLLARLRSDVVHFLMNVQPAPQAPAPAPTHLRATSMNVSLGGGAPQPAQTEPEPEPAEAVAAEASAAKPSAPKSGGSKSGARSGKSKSGRRPKSRR